MTFAPYICQARSDWDPDFATTIAGAFERELSVCGDYATPIVPDSAAQLAREAPGPAR